MERRPGLDVSARKWPGYEPTGRRARLGFKTRSVSRVKEGLL